MAANGLHQKNGHATAVPWSNLRLPPFPQVAVRVLELANNENVQLQQLCDLISTDPAFASEVLTISNSLLYAPRYPSTTILQAVSMLGANTLQGVCVTAGVRAYLGKAMSYPAMRNLWRHNLACAIIAKQIAESGSLGKDTAYTAGILHDIGRIALAAIQPKGYAALLDKHRGPATSMLEAEREMFGWDHCEAGQQLIHDWQLPESIRAVVANHHSERRADDAWGLSEVAKVSCALASAAGFPAFSGCETANYTELLDTLPEQERTKFHPDAETLRGELGRSIHAIESV